MSDVGWDALRLWGEDAARIERLASGPLNEVWAVTVRGQKCVARLNARSDADLGWEANLLEHLDRQGLVVPRPIPTLDGRLVVGGLMVMTFIDGQPPRSDGDWRRVADTLRAIHEATKGWPQRPGWRSSTDLLTAASGTRINLDAMPPEAVLRCRTAWGRLAGRPTSVVHGDPNARNVLMTADRVGLIDWDEAHVDVPDLDLGLLPGNAAGLDAAAHDRALQASAAWEAAVCWKDDHAVRRLAQVRPV